MRPYILVLAMLCVAPNLFAQYVYTIKADSVKITNHCDTAELILENHTQNVLGFLYNKGRGRTEFRKVVKLDDSTFIFGDDTMVLRGSVAAENGLSVFENKAVLGQDVGQEGNPAALYNNREIPAGNYKVSLTGNDNRNELSSSRIFLRCDNPEYSPIISMETYDYHFLDIAKTIGYAVLQFGSMEPDEPNTAFFMYDTGHFGFGTGYNGDNGKTVQVHGTTYLDDTLFLVSTPTGTASDSVLVTNQSNKGVYKIAQASISSTVYRITVNNTDYSAVAGDHLIAFISLSTGRTVTLPDAASMTNKTIIIKDESGSAGTHNITIDGFGSETINGAATKVINTNFGSITMYSNGSDWFTIHQ